MYTNAISYYFETRRKICETQHTRAQIKLHFSFEKCVFWHEPRKQNETRCKGQNRPDEKKPSERKNQTNKREKRKQFKTALSRKNRTRTKVFFAEFTIKTRPRVFNKCIRRSVVCIQKHFDFQRPKMKIVLKIYCKLNTVFVWINDGSFRVGNYFSLMFTLIVLGKGCTLNHNVKSLLQGTRWKEIEKGLKKTYYITFN